ncbi:hypothetical protein RDV64_23400 (plasmid) [Acuticoccus sp. MNP-M23]|uniref:hypothetical protein n=1 Tax=Acuticoccus sp. MNP-M23 TaxID=3072793 RepID=UPI0028162F75|nr:hypothetical protein [Acuticoccus sp. MNP-M23]WMS45289.1 hypothetical protein RDV64_23400 [Acuticoccus sp. MNP-M23]
MAQSFLFATASLRRQHETISARVPLAKIYDHLNLDVSDPTLPHPVDHVFRLPSIRLHYDLQS